MRAVDRHNKVLRAAEQRARELEPHLVAAIVPVLHEAGLEAADRFERYATDHLRADASLALSAASDGVTRLSTMICVMPRPDEAETLAQEGGQAAETLHVTLAYLGEVEGPLGQFVEPLQQVAATHAPLTGTVAGAGVFSPNDGVGPSILLPDVPGLVELRVAVTEALVMAGVDYSRDHGFEAHITVDYYDAADPPSLDGPAFGAPLHFDDLYIVRGDVEMLALPLVGVPALTAAAKSEYCLPARLRANTDPVRKSMVENVARATLEGAGISFDVTNPYIGKALEKTGSMIEGISKTTQADVVRTIGTSYQAGLSIRDTAQAIRDMMTSTSLERATLIARTEMAGAINGASLASMQAVTAVTGDPYTKTWMTAPGARFPRHEDYDGLDGQTVGLNDYFDVGGSQLQHPGDPDGDAENVVNCRCAISYNAGSGTVIGDGESDIGITPFRSSMDDPTDFYNSDRYNQFQADVQGTAAHYGVTVNNISKVDGVWEGQTEPSVALKVRDGVTGVRAYSANLGRAYGQDGVMIFNDAAHSDAMLTFDSAPRDKVLSAMSRAGLSGGRFTADGRLQIVGSGTDFVKQGSALAADLGVKYSAETGSMSILGKDHYGPAIRDFHAHGTSASGRPAMSLREADRGQHRVASAPHHARTDLEARARARQRLAVGLSPLACLCSPREEPLVVIAQAQALLAAAAGPGWTSPAPEELLSTTCDTAKAAKTIGTELPKVAAPADPNAAMLLARKGQLRDAVISPVKAGLKLDQVGSRTYVAKAGQIEDYHGIPLFVEDNALPADYASSASAFKYLEEHLNTVHDLVDFDKFRAAIHQISIVGGRSPNDSIYAKMYRIPEFRSAATTDTRSTILWEGGLRLDDTLTLYHEMGHSFGYNSGPPVVGKWVIAQAKDKTFGQKLLQGGSFDPQRPVPGKVAAQIGRSSVSEYGSVASNEDWAESVGMYLQSAAGERTFGEIAVAGGQTRPALFADVYPERAKLIDEALGKGPPVDYLNEVSQPRITEPSGTTETATRPPSLEQRIGTDLELDSVAWSGEWRKSLTEGEYNAVNRYQDIQELLKPPPAGSQPQPVESATYGAVVLNDVLRNQPTPVSVNRQAAARQIALLDLAIAKSVTPTDVVVVRGISSIADVMLTKAVNLNSLIGQTFHDAGFMSASLLESVVSSMLNSSTSSKDAAVLELHLPKGTSAALLGGDAMQVLLPRSTSFKITDIIHVGGVLRIVASIVAATKLGG